MNSGFPLGYKRAICYSGFRDGQSPDAGQFPSEHEISFDLHLLAQDWDAIRLYACDPHAETVLRLIQREEIALKVMLGAYIGAELSNENCPWGGEHTEEQLAANKQSNQEEIQRLIAWANRFSDVVDCLAAEATVDWTDHLVDPESVAAYVRRSKHRQTNRSRSVKIMYPGSTSSSNSPKSSMSSRSTPIPSGNINL